VDGTEQRRRLNDDRRRNFGGAGRPLALLCECGDDACFQTVLLSVADYDATRPGPIVHPAHGDPSWYQATPNPTGTGTSTPA
jgi:hypothetical protein